MKELGERLKQLRSEKDLSLDMVVYDLEKIQYRDKQRAFVTVGK